MISNNNNKNGKGKEHTSMKLNGNNLCTKIGLIALTSAAGVALPAFADVIDFENQPAGPTVFASASPSPQTVVTDNTTFTGGVILTDTSSLPADETTVYGTANFGSGLSNPLTISNPTGFNNFFFSLLNGENSPQTFVVADNAGHSATFSNIPANTSSGSALVGFASTGTVITITDTSNPGTFDFFIDNVNFDVPLPPSLGGSVPEASSTVWLMAGGLLCLAAFAKRSRATA